MASESSSRSTSVEHCLLSTSAEALRGASNLSALLDKEFASLRGGDLQALQQTTPCKLELIGQLEHLGEALRRGFGSLGFGVEAHTITAWLTATSNARLRRNLEELRVLLESCRHQNRANGALMEALKVHAHRAIQLLSGECDNEEVYSVHGEPRPRMRSRYTATV